MALAEITVHVVLGMDAATPLRDAMELAEQLKQDIGYHPDLEKIEECLEIASAYIEVRKG